MIFVKDGVLSIVHRLPAVEQGNNKEQISVAEDQ